MLNISTFNLGDADSREICEIMMKEFIRDKKLNISEQVLYDLVIDKVSVTVYDEDIKEYQDKIINKWQEK